MGAMCPGKRPALWTGGPAEGQGPHSEGPTLLRAGFKVGTDMGQERGGPSGLTLSRHGARGAAGTPTKDLNSEVTASQRQKEKRTTPTTKCRGKTDHRSTLPLQHWRTGLGLRRPRHPRRHRGDHSVEPPTPGRNLCTARLAAWMGPHPRPGGHSGGVRAKSHTATSANDT